MLVHRCCGAAKLLRRSCRSCCSCRGAAQLMWRFKLSFPGDTAWVGQTRRNQRLRRRKPWAVARPQAAQVQLWSPEGRRARRRERLGPSVAKLPPPARRARLCCARRVRMQVPQQALARDTHVELGGEGGKARRAASVPRLEAPDSQQSRADADSGDETGACVVVRGAIPPPLPPPPPNPEQ